MGKGKLIMEERGEGRGGQREGMEKGKREGRDKGKKERMGEGKRGGRER